MVLLGLKQNYRAEGTLGEQVTRFLNYHSHQETARHVMNVAIKAHELAEKFDANIVQAETAGWLHDISVIFPAKERAQIARSLNVDVLPEEDIFPMIIHQKLSVVLAQEIFGVDDEVILSAIGCHTTLKRDASLIDHVVFVADKIAWDQPGNPPYLEDITTALEQSIQHASLVYLKHLFNMREQLKVLHPWAKQAYEQLSDQLLPQSERKHDEFETN